MNGVTIEGRMGGEGDNGENRENDRRIKNSWTYQSLDAVTAAQLRESWWVNDNGTLEAG